VTNIEADHPRPLGDRGRRTRKPSRSSPTPSTPAGFLVCCVDDAGCRRAGRAASRSRPPGRRRLDAGRASRRSARGARRGYPCGLRGPLPRGRPAGARHRAHRSASPTPTWCVASPRSGAPAADGAQGAGRWRPGL
jgi:hypothetical protein